MTVSEAPVFAYMQARIQARHGERLSAEHWQQLEASRDLGHYLQLLRQTPLVALVRHLSPTDPPSSWERSLRRDWNEYLDQVSDWAPVRWRDTLYWLHLLPVLPGIAHLLAGRDPLPWMREDDFFLGLELSSEEGFRESLAQSRWGELLQHWQDPQPIRAWFYAWQNQLPKGEQATWEHLRAGWARLEQSQSLLLGSRSTWRDSLEKQFVMLIRRRARTVLSLLGHIGMVSLDTQRLRAKLLGLYLASYPMGPQT